MGSAGDVPYGSMGRVGSDSLQNNRFLQTAVCAQIQTARWDQSLGAVSNFLSLWFELVVDDASGDCLAERREPVLSPAQRTPWRFQEGQERGPWLALCVCVEVELGPLGRPFC